MPNEPSDRQPETAPDGAPATGFPETPGQDPGDRSRDPTPYTELNNPVGEPDPTEWPDPYDRREDPLAPPEELTFGDEDPHPPTGSTSTSQPHPSDDPEAVRWEGPERDNLDE
jgi:hypothetical protein